MPVTPPTCTTCRHCLRTDTGYSNVTTDGWYLQCLLSLNPHMDACFDETSDPKGLDVALECERYLRGDPAWFDVDREHFPEVGQPSDADLLNYCDAAQLPVLRAWLIQRELRGQHGNP